MGLEIKEIVRGFLFQNGFDGLFSSNECGCLAMENFMPCDKPRIDCEAGYKMPCPGEDCELEGKCDFHVGPEKEVKVKDEGRKQQPALLYDLNRGG